MKTIHFQIGIACVSSQSYATHKSIIASFVVCLFFLSCVSYSYCFCRFQSVSDTWRRKGIEHIWHVCTHTHTRNTLEANIYSLSSFALHSICGTEIFGAITRLSCVIFTTQHTVEYSSSKCLKCVNESFRFSSFRFVYQFFMSFFLHQAIIIITLLLLLLLFWFNSIINQFVYCSKMKSEQLFE